MLITSDEGGAERHAEARRHAGDVALNSFVGLFERITDTADGPNKANGWIAQAM